MERVMNSYVGDVTNLECQHSSPELNNQEMDSTLLSKQGPVSNCEVKPTSSGLKKQKLPHVCKMCNKAFPRKVNLVFHMKCHLKEKSFRCEVCAEVFSRKSDLRMHQKIHKSPKQYKCGDCNELFSIMYDLLIHKKTHKTHKQHSCIKCSEMFDCESDLVQHCDTFHKVVKSPYSKDLLFEKVKHFKRQNDVRNIFTKTIIVSNEMNQKDFHSFFNSIRTDVLNELNYQLQMKKSIKWYAAVKVDVCRESQDGNLERATPFFLSKSELELTDQNIQVHVENAFLKLYNGFEDFTERVFNWTLRKILKLELYTAQYDRLI